MHTQWMCWSLPAILAGLTGLSLAAPLSFNAALDLAEQQAPGLAADTAQIAAAHLAAIPAGALPDPKLFVGVDNYPVSGAERWQLNSDGMTMRKFGLTQEVPNAAKRSARIELAEADVDIAEAQRRIEQLAVRRNTALAWLDRYYLERKLVVFDELDHENRILAAAVQAQLAAGRGQVADVVMPKQEAAQLADRRDDLVRDLAKARANLRRYVGAAADELLLGEPPPLALDALHLREHVHQHPELLAYTAETRKAEAELQAARAEKKPDWGVELAYQHRAPQFGDMVSLQFNIDLPIFAAARQDPLIAAKQQQLARIDGEREDLLRGHTDELENSLADHEALARQLERAEHTLLPLAQQKVDLQYTSYKAGSSDLSAVLAARRELVDQRLRIIDLESQGAAIAVRLFFAYGESAP